MQLKKCTTCREKLSIDNFGKNRNTRDGYSGQCKSCVSKAQKLYYEKNREKLIERAIKYNNENKEKIRNRAREYNKTDAVRLKHKAYYEKNKELLKEKSRQYKKNNPTQRANSKQKARAKLANNGVYKVSKKFLRKLYSSPCVVCQSVDKITADHVIPISRGGRHSEGNLQPLCRSCNCSKHSKTMMEWRLFLQKSAV